MIWTIKNAMKKLGSPCVSRVIFTGCALKIQITCIFMQNLVCYLGDAKFALESKFSFIDISSIASFKLFFIAWLQEHCTFLDSSVVSLKSSPWPKYIHLRTIFQKKVCSTIKLFLFFKYVLY